MFFLHPSCARARHAHAGPRPRCCVLQKQPTRLLTPPTSWASALPLHPPTSSSPLHSAGAKPFAATICALERVCSTAVAQTLLGWWWWWWGGVFFYRPPTLFLFGGHRCCSTINSAHKSCQGQSNVDTHSVLFPCVYCVQLRIDL